jgi:hypothetical protein
MVTMPASTRPTATRFKGALTRYQSTSPPASRRLGPATWAALQAMSVTHQPAPDITPVVDLGPAAARLAPVQAQHAGFCC